MYTVPREGTPKEKALLAGIKWTQDSSQTVQDHLDELGLLTETAGGEIAGQVIQTRDRPDAATFVGKGKAQSIANQAQELGCDLIIFDDELSPSQQKNLQRLAGENIKVIDRSGLILDIFAQHARTWESKTQVELARLQYVLPRLSGLWTHLERQRGGIGTRGGPGEAQIEVDRRMTRTRIAQLQSDLKQIARERSTQSQRRQAAFRVSLVGYTNAGKSTLMNSLTGADVFVEDQLFATLDTTTRKMDLGDNRTILLSDTVGFIRKLPHHLVASFRSTLAEVAEANLILKILDCSSPQIEEHLATINEVLHDMGIADKPSLVVLNKLDALNDNDILNALQRQHPDAVIISAKQGLRLDQLEEVILKAYREDFVQADLRVPPGRARLVNMVYKTVEVESHTYDGDTTVLTVRGPKAILRSLQHKLAE